MGCHSEDTQVLTPQGIKDWKEIKIGDKILGADESLNLVETTVEEVFKYKYSGQMIRFHNNNCYDLLVTPNHTMIFKKKNGDFNYIPATEMLNSEGQIASSFNWESNENKISLVGYKIDDILQVIAWYISDGNIVRNRGKPTSFQIRKSKHKEEIHTLLKRMGLKYGFYEGSKFIINEPVIAEYLRINCKEHAANKTIPDDILSLSKNHLSIFFETLMKGDGYKTEKMCRYYTSSFNLLQKFLLLSLRLGYHANYKNRGKRVSEIKGRMIRQQHDSYEIGVQRQAKGWYASFGKSKSIDIQDYEGIVWCFKTDTGNFFTVRNGKISFSGNSGKTLTCTQLGFKNWFFKKQKIYSNYRLYKIPYYYVDRVRQFDYMHEGVVLLDEIWRICDARLSRKSANKFVADILARSRKRQLVYIFTAQVIDTIDKRIRKVLDFTAFSTTNRLETVYKTAIFRTGYPKLGTYLKTIYFTSEIPMQAFSTQEEIDMIDDTGEEGGCPEPKIMWQEAAAKCLNCGAMITANPNRCDPEYGGCGSRNVEPIQPIFFDTYEEADSHASKFWEKWFVAKGYTVSKTLS
jgi:hypothetical protein